MRGSATPWRPSRRPGLLACSMNVGHASRPPGRAKRGLDGAEAAPFGAAGQARRLPYFPGATSTLVVLPRLALTAKSPNTVLDDRPPKPKLAEDEPDNNAATAEAPSVTKASSCPSLLPLLEPRCPGHLPWRTRGRRPRSSVQHGRGRPLLSRRVGPLLFSGGPVEQIWRLN